MSLSRDSRQERKMKAFRRAQYQLQQRLQLIDWEEDVLLPEIMALKAGKTVLGIGGGTAFDIQIEDEAGNIISDTPGTPTKATH